MIRLRKRRQVRWHLPPQQHRGEVAPCVASHVPRERAVYVEATHSRRVLVPSSGHNLQQRAVSRALAAPHAFSPHLQQAPCPPVDELPRCHRRAFPSDARSNARTHVQGGTPFANYLLRDLSRHVLRQPRAMEGWLRQGQSQRHAETAKRSARMRWTQSSFPRLPPRLPPPAFARWTLLTLRASVGLVQSAAAAAKKAPTAAAYAPLRSLMSFGETHC
mmetsp:Transcript_174/g.536  ORF Transcript_174/g.536 Transcript_174/m.536 type:complete len:218 (+) Transcript_174:490-1143(+)